MKLISKNVALEYLGAPGVDELETWCKENGYYGVAPTRDTIHIVAGGRAEDLPSDHILAAALWHARNEFPDAENMDVCSYGGLVSYLATGWYGGFGTDQYQKERQAENIVLSLAGGIAPGPDDVFCFAPAGAIDREPGAEFTESVLRFLDGFYFSNAEAAVAEAIQDVEPVVAARAVLALARNQAEYENLARVADGFLKRKQIFPRCGKQ